MTVVTQVVGKIRLPHFYVLTVLGCLAAYMWILAPTWDDGVLGFTTWNTAVSDRAFYNDVHGEVFPFHKISVVIFTAFFKIGIPFSFRTPAVIGGVLLTASAALTYVLARKYASPRTSFLAASLIFYYLFTERWVSSPARFELWLLPVVLLVLLLVHRFIREQAAGYLVLASVVTGVVALPIHTNASILYIYLVLVVWFYRHLLSYRRLLLAVGTLGVSTAIGVGIVLFPEPHSALRFMRDLSSEGHRLTFILGEVERVLRGAANNVHAYPTLFFVGVTVALVVLWWKSAADDTRRLVVDNLPLALYAIAVFAALALLPSAPWDMYLAYYLPAAVVFVAALYLKEKEAPGGRIEYIFPLAMTVAFAAGAALTGIFHPRGFDAVWLLSLPFLVAPYVALSVLWVREKKDWIYPVLVMGLLFRLVFIVFEGRAYAAVEDYAVRQDSRQIVTSVHFTWLGDETVTPTRPGLELGQRGFAAIGADQWPSIERLLDNSGCSYRQTGRILETFDNSLIGNHYRDISTYDFACNE